MFTSKPPTCAGRTLALPRKDRDIRYLRPLGNSDIASFVGQIPNETIASYCAAADLFVLPSLLEACPTVALEALACGTPVVSSDNPGGAELSTLFGEDVRVVPLDDDALARAIVEELGRCRRVLETTLTRIEREFRPSGVWARFRQLYQQALSPTHV